MPPFWQTPASRRHAEVLALLHKLNSKVYTIMAFADDTKTGLAEIKTLVVEVAGDLDEVIAKLEAGTVSPEDQAAILADVQAIRDSLSGVAAKVPEPEPPV